MTPVRSSVLACGCENKRRGEKSPVCQRCTILFSSKRLEGKNPKAHQLFSHALITEDDIVSTELWGPRECEVMSVFSGGRGGKGIGRKSHPSSLPSPATRRWHWCDKNGSSGCCVWRLAVAVVNCGEICCCCCPPQLLTCYGGRL